MDGHTHTHTHTHDGTLIVPSNASVSIKKSHVLLLKWMYLIACKYAIWWWYQAAYQLVFIPTSDKTHYVYHSTGDK